MEKETQNELRAQRLLKKLKRKPNVKIKRPFFVEITGSPDAGKTTMIEILDSFFRRQGFRVFCPQEGAQKIRHIDRDTHLYNVRTALYALTELIDASVNPNYDLVIFDRCLHDGFTWMLYWNQKGDIKQHQMRCLQDFFMFPTWLNMVDVSFFVVTTTEEAIKRDRAESLTKKWGATTNPKSIENKIMLNKSAFNMTGKSEKKNSDKGATFLFDTTGLSETKMTECVLEKTLDALEKRFE